MRNSIVWQDWTADLSAQRLRNMVDEINTHQQVTGNLTQADAFLKRILMAELERRYADVEGN